MDRTHTYIDFDPENEEKTKVIIRGKEDDVNRAVKLVEDYVHEQVSCFPYLSWERYFWPKKKNLIALTIQ